MKNEQIFPLPTKETNEQKAALAPEIFDTWRNFSKVVFKEAALPEKTK